MKISKIRYKLFISYTLICIVPVILTTLIIYNYANANIKSNSYDFIDLYANQLADDIYQDFEKIDNLSKSIFYSNELFVYFEDTSAYDIGDKIKYKVDITKLLNAYSIQNPDIYGVSIISKNGEIFQRGYQEELLSYDKMKNLDWFQDILTADGNMVVSSYHTVPFSTNTISSTVVSFGRLLKTSQGEAVGLLIFDKRVENVVPSRYKTDFSKTYDAITLITNKSGIIYSSMDSEESIAFNASYEKNNYIITEKYIDNDKIKLSIYVPTAVILKKNNQLLILTSTIIVISTLMVVVTSLLLSQQFSAPILRLSKAMNQIEEGQYKPVPPDTRADEIGILNQSYNLMVQRIKTLIEDVYVAKLNKKEAELAALQSQINPHMLYNTLESIRMKAIINKDNEVANMIKILGKMFRLALNRREGMNYIFDEITYIETYINLQNIRYENRFHFLVNMTDDVLNAQIINLIFQPIVENSIIHAFKDIKENCQIIIEGYSNGRFIIVTIKDNGKGMSAEKVSSINAYLRDNDALNKGGIGIKNIASRLRLHYGNTCTVTYQSNKSEGTVVTIQIPLI